MNLRASILILFTLCGCAVPESAIGNSQSALQLDPALPGGAPKAIYSSAIVSADNASVIQPTPGATIRILPHCVELIWDPTSNSANVYCGNASHSYERLIPAGTNNTALIDGLNNGQNYYFAVTAVDAFGVESDFSAELKAEPGTILELQFSEGNFTRLESSPDLVNWSNRNALSISSSSSSSIWHAAMNPNLPQEFFRAVQPAGD